MEILVWSILVLGVSLGVIAAIRRWIKTVQVLTQRNWASVPNPEWKAKRGGVEIW